MSSSHDDPLLCIIGFVFIGFLLLFIRVYLHPEFSAGIKDGKDAISDTG